MCNISTAYFGILKASFFIIYSAVHVTDATKASLGDYFNCDPVPEDDIAHDEVLSSSGLNTFLIWPDRNEYNLTKVTCKIFINNKRCLEVTFFCLSLCCLSIRMQILQNSIFMYNWLMGHLIWPSKGLEVGRKWTGSGPEVDWKWTGSRPKVDLISPNPK